MTITTKSYLAINTYSPDGNQQWNMCGIASTSLVSVAGTYTPWTSTYGVSSFSLANSVPTGITPVLNTTSGFGSFDQNLSAVIAGGAYTANNEAVFNWNGNPSTPGFGCNTLVNTGSGALIDTLAASDWALVKDAEISINTADAAGIHTLSINNFQGTNIQYGGANASISLDNAQSGTLDLSKQTGHNTVSIYNAVVDTTQQATACFALTTGVGGDVVNALADAASVIATDYNGGALTANGAGNLLNATDGQGDNAFNLSNTSMSSIIHIGSGAASETLSFIAGQDATMTHGNAIVLSAAGTGASDIEASLSNVAAVVQGFKMGRDVMHATFTGSYLVGDRMGTNATQAYITDASGAHGVVFQNTTAAFLSAHLSAAGGIITVH